MKSTAIVVPLPGGDDQARKLAARLGAELVVPEVHVFPDGELCIQVDPARVAGRDAVLCGSLHQIAGTTDRFLLLAFVADTLRDHGARRVGLVAPYLAYMRQDEAFAPGQGVSARYFGKLVSRTVDWLVTVDPHLHRLPSLDGIYSIPTTIARAAPSIASWIASEVTHPVLVGPDAESVQWVQAVAEHCGAEFVILEKTRRGDRDVSVAGGVQRAWNGHQPVLIDDIVSTGRTMIEATRLLRAAGSVAPVCVAIHAVFADAVDDQLTGAGARGIVTCDTIPHATNRICVADPIAEAVRGHLTA
ncbi:MAG TPA: ribose-phosphate diphosphokinase [Acidimicrobiia bacterium]|nr:ribose-phosphate diphosphokinase [Acidimicrobiia bacterium]